jgi:hypothetical protein
MMQAAQLDFGIFEDEPGKADQRKRDIERGERLRVKGIEQAVSHAEAEIENWTAGAMAHFKTFLSGLGYSEFMCEDARAWAESRGYPKPPTKRAWAGIIIKAKAAGLIEWVSVGKVTNPKAHRAHASLWRKK